MELIEISIKIIDRVLSKETNFLQSLKEECKFLDKFEKSKVSSLVGMYFRNYFLISAFLKEHNLKENQRNSILLGLTFINNSFKHVEKDEEMLKFLFDELSKFKFDVNEEFKNDLNNLITLRRSYEFKNIKRNSIDGFSIRYNLPVWLIKLVINQYGKEDGLLVLKTLSNMPTQYLSINFERKIESSKDLENFTKLDEDLYIYNLDKTVKKEKLVFDNILYLTQKDYKNIFKDLELYPHSNITYFGDSSDNVIIDFVKKFYREDDTFYFVTPKLENNFQVMDKVKKFKKRNFYFHELSASAIRTYSGEGEDLIMYSPNSSDFDLFRRNPEYGVYFDKNSFDDIQNNIKNEISELTKYIKKEGYLIYFVPTINKKETSFIKDYVLSLNEEFELIKEELYLPLKKEDSLFYYFIIRRK